VVKSKDSLNKTFTYKDLEGTVRATYASKFVPSPIEGADDDGYYYSEIAFPEYNVVHGIDFDNEYSSFPTQTRKSFVKSLAKIGYIGRDGKVREDQVKNTFKGPAVPELITAYLQLEEEQKLHLDYIHERDKSDPVTLVKGKSEQANKQYLKNVGYSPFFFDDYKIKQGDEVIGKVKVRYTAELGGEVGAGFKKGSDPKIYFFNMKGGRVAWSHGLFHDLKIHKGNTRLKKTTSDFLEEDNIFQRIKAISKYLVQQGKL